MANSNTTTSVVDQIFAQSLLALRQYAVMPRYVNRQYDTSPGQKFSTIAVPIPSAISAAAVTPSNTPPNDTGVSPTKVTITLDKWYETAFFVNDKEVNEIVAGVVDGQLSEAVKGLANQVDTDIFATYSSATAGIYGYGGVAGTTPFASGFDEFTEARAALSRQLAPTGDRYFVMDPDAEANALGLRAVQDASYRPGSGQAALQEGELGRLLGALWAVDQNVPQHTAGTASGATTDSAGYAIGVKTVTLASAGTGSILVGDIITFTKLSAELDPQTYVVTVGDGSVAGGGTISFEPGLKVAMTTATKAITVKATHRLNLLFHRDAIALAARPLESADPFGLTNGLRRSIMDPVSGLSLTLEISRQHYRTRIALSSLYGVMLVRPELAARVAG
jgi:hypothetical protein